MNELKITPSPTVCRDKDGNIYSTVIIGSQVWISENLKTTKFNDGTAITFVDDENASSGVWASHTTAETPAYCRGGSRYLEAIDDYEDTYGYLYNWHAVNDSRGIAPTGWHVPTDDDVKELEIFLGMSQSEVDGEAFRGTNEGSKLAGNASLWTNGNLEDDSEFGTSGFNALPGGYRGQTTGRLYGLNSTLRLWTATEYDTDDKVVRELLNSLTGIRYDKRDKGSGASVRLLLDKGMTFEMNPMTSQAMSGVSITIPPSHASSDRWNTFGIPWNVSKEYWAIT